MTKCQQETRQSLKDPARRDLIAGAAGAVGLVVFGGFICHSNVSEASLVRPPGSRPEAEFLARWHSLRQMPQRLPHQCHRHRTF